MPDFVLWSSKNGDVQVHVPSDPPKNNYAASAAPTVNDDSGDGYSQGSIWANGNDVYICTDATAGAANWVKIGPTV